MNMKVSLLLTALDKASKVVLRLNKTTKAANAGMVKDAGKVAQATDKVSKSQQKLGQSIEKANSAAAKSAGEVGNAERAYNRLTSAAKKLWDGGKNWAVNQIAQMRKVGNEAERLAKAQERAAKRQERWRKSAASIGSQIGKGIRQPINGVRKIGSGMMQAGKTAAGLYTGAGLYGGMSYVVANKIVAPAKEIEQFEIALRTAGQTAEQAKKSIQWVSDQSLPFSIDKATDAFVTLYRSGINPTEKSFAILGDAATDRRKSIEETAKAVSKALRGSTQALSEYGITAKKSAKNGKYIEYGFIGKDGRSKVIRALAQSKNSQYQAISKIFENKYSGAAERQAGSWAGMNEQVQGFIERMQFKIANAGVYDFLKSKFSDVLKVISDLEKSGTLDVWAKRISDNLITGIQVGWEVLKGIGSGIKWVAEQLQWLDQNVISFANQGKILLALPFVPALLSIGSGIFSIIFGVTRLSVGLMRLIFFIGRIVTFTTIVGVFKAVAVAARIAGFAFMFLGRAIMATPIGWIITGIAAVAGAVYLIYQNWDKIIPWLKGLWNSFIAVHQAAWEWIKSQFTWSPLETISNAWSGVAGYFGGWGETVLGALKEAINKIKAWVGPAVENISKVFSKVSEGVKAAWNAVFSGSSGDVQESLEKGLTANPAQLAAVEAATAGIKTNMEAIASINTSTALAQVAGLSGDAAKAQEAISKLTSATSAAVQTVRSYLSSVSLQSYGVAFMTTLAAGIRAGAGQAVAAVRETVQTMRDHLPHSPAKVGPLSDLHRVKFSETLAGAIKPGPAVAAVRAVATGMAAALPLSMAAPAMSAPMSSGLPAGQAAGGASIVLNYSPTITVPAGADSDQQFSRQLREHSDELKRMFEEIVANNERVSY